MIGSRLKLAINTERVVVVVVVVIMAAVDTAAAIQKLLAQRAAGSASLHAISTSRRRCTLRINRR